MQHARPLLALALGIAISGCGPSDEKSNNDVVVVNAAPNNANNTTPNSNDGANSKPIEEQMLSDRDQAIFDGFNVPADAKSAADGALSLTVEAVVLASIAANGGNALETTGTLTQSGESFTYAAGPADRLVVEWSEGPATEIYVSQLDGDFEAETIEDFFIADHVVQARVVRDGIVDITVGSGKSGDDSEGGITGTIIEEGKSYELELSEVTSRTIDVDVSSNSYESNSTLTGVITGPDVSLVVEEEYYYKSIYVDNFVQNSTRTTNSRWTHNGNEYAVDGVFIRSAFFDGWPDEFDFWRAEGVITENGVPVGQVQFEENEVVLYVILVLDSGEKITLQEHLKYQDPDG